jgi:hypothetical protein
LNNRFHCITNSAASEFDVLHRQFVHIGGGFLLIHTRFADTVQINSDSNYNQGDHLMSGSPKRFLQTSFMTDELTQQRLEILAKRMSTTKSGVIRAGVLKVWIAMEQILDKESTAA